MISRGGHLASKVLRVVESLILVSVLDRFLVHELIFWLYPRQEDKQTEPQSIMGKCTNNMMQYMNDMRDVICNANACFRRTRMIKESTWQTNGTAGKMR